jgi:flagellar biosynthesis anti-sigma factor FlgM
MNIDRIGSLANDILTEQAASRTHRSVATDTAQNAGVHTTLSGDTSSVASLVALAMQTPAVRQHKIDALRAAVTSGTYSIDPSEIASALVKQQVG